MIRVNGVALDNVARGWIFRPASVPYGQYDANIHRVAVQGRDGGQKVLNTLDVALMPLTVNTPPSGWAALQALFQLPVLTLTRDDNPDVHVQATFASSTVDRVFRRNEFIEATFFLAVEGVFWRSKLPETVSVPLSSASVGLNVQPGMSAAIGDAVVRLKGAASGVQVTDSSGAWVTFPTVPAGSYVRFESKTGKAFLTTTDTWTGGVDVSGDMDFGGPRTLFEITPTIAGIDPTNRFGQLTIASATRTGAEVAVRSYGAYAI